MKKSSSEPILDNNSKNAVFEKILEGKLSYEFIKDLKLFNMLNDWAGHPTIDYATFEAFPMIVFGHKCISED